MLAIGCLEVLSYYGAIKAAHKLLTPLLRPLLGVPGLTGLALITDLQSTDAGAALTKELYDQELITKKELTIIGMAVFRCRPYQQLLCNRLGVIFILNGAITAAVCINVCF